MGKTLLTENEVHVWRSRLNLPDTQINQFVKHLSKDEQERAGRFRREEDRDRFIAARGTLREILGRYLECAPQDLEFSYTDKGKPYLSDACPRLEFNVSHSHNLAVYGISGERAIGIDLEYLRPLPNANPLAKRFFTEREWKALNALPYELQALAFFKTWTCKEAYLKATGEGLAGLQEVEVIWGNDNAPKLEILNSYSSQRWQLYSLDMDCDYVGALTIFGIHCQVREFEFIPIS